MWGGDWREVARPPLGRAAQLAWLHSLRNPWVAVEGGATMCRSTSVQASKDGLWEVDSRVPLGQLAVTPIQRPAVLPRCGRPLGAASQPGVQPGQALLAGRGAAQLRHRARLLRRGRGLLQRAAAGRRAAGAARPGALPVGLGADGVLAGQRPRGQEPLPPGESHPVQPDAVGFRTCTAQRHDY